METDGTIDSGRVGQMVKIDGARLSFDPKDEAGQKRGLSVSILPGVFWNRGTETFTSYVTGVAGVLLSFPAFRDVSLGLGVMTTFPQAGQSSFCRLGTHGDEAMVSILPYPCIIIP